RFQPVKVEEPTAEDTIKILKGIRSSFENFHNVKISDDAIDAAVNLSIRYITNRYLPDKAIDLIDEACSKLRVNASAMPDEVRELNRQIAVFDRMKEEYRKRDDFINADKMNKQKLMLQNQISEIRKELLFKTGTTFGEISAENIREVVASWTNIPVKKLTSSERETLLNLENILSERVIGQPQAVSVVSKAIRRSRADINDPKRPIGSFLFLGPTGVGKTELTKAIADVLFDNEDSIIRFDMSEFMESHSVSRLIGAPPGYVGHEDGGELTEAVRKKPYSIVLFDEIEKAHSDIFNIMLQIFDEGRLTDSAGKVVSFKNTLIILTSNNGVQDLLARRKFEREHPEQKRVETEEFLMDKLRDNFKPELLNRIDSVVIFDSLQKDSIMKIADIMLNSLEKRFVKKNISLEITTSARILICEKGYDEMYGARPLKRVIDKEIKDPLAEMIISGNLQDNSAVRVDANGDKFDFKVLC
ncbi:MAG: ATP-dependent Clp protease ATP-binding subunit, partial [Clostridia bacterium]|nr:ATP-dependent Clp protease ATP-binding subunit [Clostridia bacterium]